MDISIEPHCKGINLNCNAPLPKYKIIRHKPSIKPSLSWWIDFGSPEQEQQEYDPIEAAQQERQKQALARLERQKIHSELFSKTITRVSKIVKQKQEAIKTLIEKERETAETLGLSKSLSSEDLQLNQLPAERNYQVFPNEKYHIHQQYISNQTHTPLKKTRNELEKDLRMFYRVGHVEEMKRHEFGKHLQETRKHYMQLEKNGIKREKKMYNPNKYT